MRTSEIQIFKKLASRNFRLKDVEFVEFIDIGKSDISQTLTINKDDGLSKSLVFDADLFEIVAELKIKYEGEYPQSYRVLNSMIMDWVDSNENNIKKILNPKLKDFLNSSYPEIDTSDLDENMDDYIWEDQVDYHPEVEEEEGVIHFTLELVLNVEEEGE